MEWYKAIKYDVEMDRIPKTERGRCLTSYAKRYGINTGDRAERIRIAESAACYSADMSIDMLEAFRNGNYARVNVLKKYINRANRLVSINS